MPWPPQDDAPPLPPKDFNGQRRSFTPLIRLAMRMGWIDTLIQMGDGVMPATEVMLPFSYIAAYEENDSVFVFGVVRGEPMNWKEPKTLFPTDGFVGRLKLLV
jgi:hypothetical protein